MSILSMVLAFVSDTPLLSAVLIVSSLILIIGLLLLLFPRSEQRPSKPALHKPSRPPQGQMLPGYRILSEEARVPKQFLAVPRLSVLDPGRNRLVAEPIPDQAETTDPLDMPDRSEPGGTPTEVALPSSSQDENTTVSGEPASSIDIDDAPTLPSLTHSRADIELALASAPKPNRRITRPLPEMEHLDVAGVTPSTPGNPQDLESVSTDASAPAPQESETAASEPPEEIAEEPFPAVSTDLQADTAIKQAGAAAPIRKARLSSVLAETAAERSSAQAAARLAQPTAPTPLPISAARRARLSGFPLPGSRPDDGQEPPR